MSGSSWVRGPAARLVALALSLPAGADEVNVFAASSLADVLKEIAAGFESRTGHRVVLNLGASSDLARQIQAGAPADIFFSADVAQLDRLQAAGLIRSGDRRNVLSNVLVVIVPDGTPPGLEAPPNLAQVRRLALADPRAVPAGVYAREWLESIGLWQRLADRVVPTLDVRAALAAVASGNVDAGIVYRTDLRYARRVRAAFEVPATAGPSITYAYAPLAASRKGSAAELCQELVSPEARRRYEQHGFIVLPPP